MFFVETLEGEKVATATAFYEPRDLTGAGWLHWVAVKREYQGQERILFCTETGTGEWGGAI